MSNWPPKEIEWYATQDDEHYEFGPFALKRDAMAAGKAAYAGEPFKIIKANANNMDLAKWFELDNHFLDKVQDEMDEEMCGGGEYGDHHPLAEISTDQAQELEKLIKHTIRKWQRRHRLKLRSYWVGDVLAEFEVKP